MFNLVLICPEIPQNAGNVIRLAANTGANLHLIEPLGFQMDEKKLRRARLDYHEYATVTVHPSWEEFLTAETPNPARSFALTRYASENFFDITFEPGDWLFFGRESSGLIPQAEAWFVAANKLRIPMRPGQRSLNLANTVGICVYEAWRQHGFDGAAFSE